MGYSSPKKPFDLKAFLEAPAKPGSSRGPRRFRSTAYTIRKANKEASPDTTQSS
ncbi:hypothetical protein ACXN5S_10420 [Pseudoroseicyclus sp. H15]